MLPSLAIDLSRNASIDDRNDGNNVVVGGDRFLTGGDRESRDDFLVNSVDDETDAERGPSLSRDIYLRSDGVSVDDLLVEKSMLTKWLISRYDGVVRKPRDMADAIVECVSTGTEIYLSRNDSRYVDRVEIFDADVFCLCNEWILGFVSERKTLKTKNNDDDAATAEAAKIARRETRLDDINIFDDYVVEAPIDDFIKFVSTKTTNGLPPLLYGSEKDVVNDGRDVYEEDGDNDDDDSRRQRTAKMAREKMRVDAEKLKKYANLNVDVIVERSPPDDKGGTPRTERENVLKLIVDFNELERLLTFLLYVDRNALYGDIDVTFRNKPGTADSFCFSKTNSTRGVDVRCLKNTDGDRLKDIYETVTSGGNDYDDDDDDGNRGGGRRTSTFSDEIEEDDRIDDSSEADRVLDVFEYATLLFLDKISTTIIDTVLSPDLAANRSYKFGIVDTIRPKIGKITRHKFDAIVRK